MWDTGFKGQEFPTLDVIGNTIERHFDKKRRSKHSFY